MKYILYPLAIIFLASCGKDEITPAVETSAPDGPSWKLSLSVNDKSYYAQSYKVFKLLDENNQIIGESIFFNSEELSLRFDYEFINCNAKAIGSLHSNTFTITGLGCTGITQGYAKDYYQNSSLNFCNGQQELPVWVSLNKVDKM